MRKYLVGLGAEGRRVKAVSFGSERPIAPGADETSWAKNRRVELVAEIGDTK